MTKEERIKDYYADRPIEPYSDDDRLSDWANIAHYAEENLEKAFKRIEELEKKIEELEQKIKWHYLTKNPKDLPGKDDYQIEITYVECNHKWVTLGYYDRNTKKWFTSMELPLKKVIAWKKIIKLDEDVI